AGATTAPGKYKNPIAGRSISLVSIGVSGAAFSLASNTCPATLASDEECDFSIAFNPSAATSYSGEVTVSSNLDNSPETLPIFGAGVAPNTPAVIVSAPGVDFPPQDIGTPSAAGNLTLTNSGSATL